MDNNIITAQSILLYPEQDILCGITNRLLEGKDIIWEETIKLKIKPCPKWLPVFIYHWLMGRCLIQECNFGRKNNAH